ncbi:MAG: S-layer homology domain-containing protein [Clostridia bacterium]|nr:S-layer homology domain-containing protein [Clostridia bacterium]
MKRTISLMLILTMITSLCIFVFADGADGPKKEPVGCATTANTNPAEWAKEDVDKALNLGILDSEKTYYYGSFITREAFCELIYQLCGIESKQSETTSINIENPFEDTNNPAILNLYINGIINGKGNGFFAPDDLLTREETAVIFDRLINLIGCDLVYTDDIIEYDDDESISDWARNSIQLVSHAGLMTGYKGNVFYPKSSLSTEEAIVIVMRAYDLIENTKLIPQNATFADKMNYQMPKDENYMFSPLSIKMALAMAANGAKGDTKEEILNALQIEDLETFNTFSKELIERYSKSDKLTLSIANSVWVNTDNCPHDFKQEYKDKVSEFYNANASKVNNSKAVKEINSWVNDKTNGKIPSIINDSDFWAALVNAIYFKGAWENDFWKSATKPDTFTSANGKETQIDFMQQTEHFGYFKSDNAEIVKMPYKTNFYTEDENGNVERENLNDLNVSMYLIMAKSTDVENILNKAELKYERLNLHVPKFKVEFDTELNNILQRLNMNNAFSRFLADFSGMMNLSPDEDLWIDKVLHKTYISVDEEGTEAAAVTAVMMDGATSAKPKEPIEVKFNKPFYFVIRDDTNGEILFMGRYAYAE